MCCKYYVGRPEMTQKLIKLNSKSDPLNIDFWEVYVVPTFVINEYANPMQKSISYRVVKKLAGGGVPYSGLKDKIDEAVDIIKSHYNEVEGKKL